MRLSGPIAERSCQTHIACKADCTQERHLFVSTKHIQLPPFVQSMFNLGSTNRPRHVSNDDRYRMALKINSLLFVPPVMIGLKLMHAYGCKKVIWPFQPLFAFIFSLFQHQ